MRKSAGRTIATKKMPAPKRHGLGLISAAHVRKTATLPYLKFELKKRRKPEDVGDLVAIYDSYIAAADAMLAIANQPRANGIDLINDEWNWLLRRAWETAEHMKRLQPANKGDQERFVQTLFSCALDMGSNIDEAVSVLQAAVALGTAEEKQKAT